MEKLIPVILASLVLFCFNLSALAQESSSEPEEVSPSTEAANARYGEDVLFKSLEYPELQVVPRASERIFLEAKAENDLGALIHWPIQLSGLMTMAAGLTSSDSYGGSDPNPSSYRVEQSELAAMTATGIGAGWVLGTYLLHSMKPYKSALAAVRKVKSSDKRNELLKERLAEEALQNQSDLIQTLRLLSVASNFLASTWVMAESRDRADTIAAISAGFAFLPWIFPHRQVDAYQKHIEYKRKIYSPISSMQFRADPDTAKLIPQWTLSWSF